MKKEHIRHLKRMQCMYVNSIIIKHKKEILFQVNNSNEDLPISYEIQKP